MNLFHLKYFYDSARLGSLTKAAKLNLVGQPAISKAIQNLEVTFKKPLLSHERNRFRLTDDGEIVFQSCQKIFSATDELKDVLATTAVTSGEVRLACPSSMAESKFLSMSIKSIVESHPKLSLKLALGRTDLVKDWVNAGAADFGVVIDNVDLSGLECLSLNKGFFHLVTSRTYSKDWHDEGVMTTEAKREVTDLRNRYQARYGKRMKSKMEIGSWGVIKQFVLSDMGAGFVPDYMIQNELKNKSLKLIEPKFFSTPYELRIIRKKNTYLTRRCQTVISEFERLAKEQ